MFWSAERSYDHIMQKLVKTGKKPEIDKQSDAKFWFNWMKYEAVSYSLTCNKNVLSKVIVQGGVESTFDMGVITSL